MIARGFGEEYAPPAEWELHAIQETGRRKGYRFELRRGNVSRLLFGWAGQALIVESPDAALAVIRAFDREQNHKNRQSARVLAYGFGG